MLINAVDPEESRIAVVEDGVLQELHVELASREAYLGNIYKGKVVNIEPSIGAAFVAFGGRVNGFLHVSDVLPAYGRPDFVLDDVIEGRARVDVDDGPESMQQALADDEEDDAGGADVGVEPLADGGNVSRAEDDGDVEPSESDDELHGGHDDLESVPEGADPAEPHADQGLDGGHDDGGTRRGFGHGVDEEPLNMAASEPGNEDPDHGGDDTDGPLPSAKGPAASGSEPGSDGEPGDEVRGEQEAGDAGPSHGGSGERRERRRGRRGRERADRGDRGERRPRGPRPTIDQLLQARGRRSWCRSPRRASAQKGPTLTTYVSLPGRCLVLMPSLPKCGVSRKIEDRASASA
jgi:Ribonuclease G/E